jgi:hypothetical protein
MSPMSWHQRPAPKSRLLAQTLDIIEARYRAIHHLLNSERARTPAARRYEPLARQPAAPERAAGRVPQQARGHTAPRVLHSRASLDPCLAVAKPLLTRDEVHCPGREDLRGSSRSDSACSRPRGTRRPCTGTRFPSPNRAAPRPAGRAACERARPAHRAYLCARAGAAPAHWQHHIEDVAAAHQRAHVRVQGAGARRADARCGAQHARAPGRQSKVVHNDGVVAAARLSELGLEELEWMPLSLRGDDRARMPRTHRSSEPDLHDKERDRFPARMPHILRDSVDEVRSLAASEYAPQIPMYSCA